MLKTEVPQTTLSYPTTNDKKIHQTWPRLGISGRNVDVLYQPQLIFRHIP